MKNMFILALLMASTAAYAQTAPGSVATPPGQAGAQNAGGQGQGQPGERFEDHKAKILAHIQERMTKLQGIQSCVQAATTREALHACMPERAEGGQGGQGGGWKRGNNGNGGGFGGGRFQNNGNGGNQGGNSGGQQ